MLQIDEAPEAPDEVHRFEVESFVSRFYQICLLRKPDAAGFNDWISSLLNGSRTGTDVTKNFLLSREFMSRNPSNEEYIDILYMLLSIFLYLYAESPE